MLNASQEGFQEAATQERYIATPRYNHHHRTLTLFYYGIAYTLANILLIIVRPTTLMGLWRMRMWDRNWGWTTKNEDEKQRMRMNNREWGWETENDDEQQRMRRDSSRVHWDLKMRNRDWGWEIENADDKHRIFTRQHRSFTRCKFLEPVRLVTGEVCGNI